ncbi:MAG: tRNA uridine-5-carboxymethylaminomethyl(34) synthesis enzyme MnmG [Phycisphaerae bacterium]|nr:tRNA uridine-5-carboxymethylaminomethyl(34) synthesis enzyme MnmG [Phycisphaerae bacterium]
MRKEYDIIVVGGGHAGVEAAYAAAKTGLQVALVTMNRGTIAQMSCNPAIGGLAKGQIAREVDALGGVMGLAIDASGIQFRMLNRRKGPAVWAPRAQADKHGYEKFVQDFLASVDGLTIIEDMALGIRHKAQGISKRITGIECQKYGVLHAKAVVITAGTFLRGLMHIGSEQIQGGRYGEAASNALSQSLIEAGFELGRLKTGTPARIDADTINYDKLERQPGDEKCEPFSYLNKEITNKQVDCWITYTNEGTHALIRDNLDRSPMYNDQIQSTGPRYCPSIETKIVRFSDKDRHQIFLEPEGLDTNWVYCNGISNSLPIDLQDKLIASIEGLQQAKILRYAYAIEYDYVPPTQIRATLESKLIDGLFLAGQINGTSGYEEAAGQGLVAGVNATAFIKGTEPLILGRDAAYIGVMIDDLVTKGVDEPYRMFTSRAEYRLLLRADNADERLTSLAFDYGIIEDQRWDVFEAKQRQKQEITDYLHNNKLDGQDLTLLLRQQDHDLPWLLESCPELAAKGYDHYALESVVCDMRYVGYVQKQLKLIEKFRKNENVRLPRDLDYHKISQLRYEAREKLNYVQPANLGQASRVSGINPADITVLMIYLKKLGKA